VPELTQAEYWTAADPHEWDEALQLTRTLPCEVPVRARVDELTAILLGDVYVRKAAVEDVLSAECPDSSDRETARWLLARVAGTLRTGPGPDNRTAAVHLEDLALSCRTLAAIGRLLAQNEQGATAPDPAAREAAPMPPSRSADVLPPWHAAST
jgi:hypothetical protein